MKVLFVSSGNKNGKPTSIVYNQGESLKKCNILIDYYIITGNGYWGYVKSIFKLRKFLKLNSFDLIHAHYSFSGFVAALSLKTPVVVSLMGSDLKSAGLFKLAIKLFNRFFWKVCIVKSKDMKDSLGIENVQVIPNGVDVIKFQPLSKEESLLKIGFEKNKKHILFAADPERVEKNFQLAEKACNLIIDVDFELHFLKNIPNELMPFHYNAADVVLMTSLYEGSPNVIKEALSCNTPIVATEVGDISNNIGSLNNCYVTSFDPKEIADSLKKAIQSGERPEGRGRVTELGLEASQIAQKLIGIYKEVLKRRKEFITTR
ncbi:MAG: glycosyltransferase [Bacteroidales bacterium]|nr:glycosyltransferase [Bacteroidales bacterium]